MALYDTKEKRVAFLKEGNIITLTKKGKNGGRQYPIVSLQMDGDKVRVMACLNRETEWYESMDALLDAIDWEWMEEAHSIWD